MQQELAVTQQQTLENVAGDSGRFAAEVEALVRSFEAMAGALEALLEALSEPAKEGFSRAEQLLVKAAASSKFAMDCYQQAEHRLGPTEIPALNFLLRLSRQYLDGLVQQSQVEQAIDGLERLSQAAIQELRLAEGDQPPERDALLRAYQLQSRSLDGLSQSLAGSSEAIEEALEAVSVACHQVREKMASLNLALMRRGPCRLERTNVFLNIAEAYRRQGVPGSVLIEAIENFYQELEEEQKQVEQLASLPNPNHSVLAEVDRIRDAYGEHGEALDGFSDFLENGDEHSFETARHRLIEASERLSDCKEALAEIAEMEGKVTCVRCGTPNQPGSRVCSQCGAQLPQAAIRTGPSTVNYQEVDGRVRGGEDFEVTENLLKLFEAVNAVAEGDLSDIEFEEVLIWLDGLLAESLAALPESPRLQSRQEIAVQEKSGATLLEEQLHCHRSEIVEGMNAFREALERLQLFLEDGDQEHLIQGVVAVKEASQKIQLGERKIQELAGADDSSAELT